MAIWVASRENTWLYPQSWRGITCFLLYRLVGLEPKRCRRYHKAQCGINIPKDIFFLIRIEKGNHFLNYPEEAHDIWTNMNPGRDWELAHAKGRRRKAGGIFNCISVIVFAEIQLLPLYQIDQCEKDGSSGAREDK